MRELVRSVGKRHEINISFSCVYERPDLGGVRLCLATEEHSCSTLWGMRVPE